MIKGRDLTIDRNYIQRFETLILEYEKIKRKEHEKYKYVKDFFKDNRIGHQNFTKYYHRYLEDGRNKDSLKPQKRGPRYKIRRIDIEVESKIVELRKNGLNKYEIKQIIKKDTKLKTPSHTTIYNYSVKHKLNVINKKMKEEKVRYVREKAGELAHIDCHNLGRNVIKGNSKNYYLVSLIDDFSRLAWTEVTTDIKSLTVMFAVLKCINMLRMQYEIEFVEILTDNGPEFGRKNLKNKGDNPFERLLIEMDIKHRYTRPYRPQTNGKIERFWKTLHYDLIDGTDFDTVEELKDEVLQYMYYYNALRPHQGLNGDSPEVFFKGSINASK